jgi:hypothetical protein
VCPNWEDHERTESNADRLAKLDLNKADLLLLHEMFHLSCPEDFEIENGASNSDCPSACPSCWKLAIERMSE